jgi:hypothetical protein
MLRKNSIDVNDNKGYKLVNYVSYFIIEKCLLFTPS